MKTSNPLTENDLKQIKLHGMSPDEILKQIDRFQKGFPKPRLNRICKTGDGITVLSGKEKQTYISRFHTAVEQGRVMKFVPASGAATRMFKSLQVVLKRLKSISKEELYAAARTDKDISAFLTFFDLLSNFAFYDNLEKIAASRGQDLKKLLHGNEYGTILRFLLSPEGLDFDNLPKGLIPFHHYSKGARTAFEEHLIEALSYCQSSQDRIRIHFTVPENYYKTIATHLEAFVNRHPDAKTCLEYDFSVQASNTDTVAADEKNQPFRENGKLVFRPGGHGALIHNFNHLRGDLVMIKNIDNIAHDDMKGPASDWQRTLTGYLLELEETLFGFLRSLESGTPDMKKMLEFAQSRLWIEVPNDLRRSQSENLRQFLWTKFNRPLRVCGVVKNEGEPGGGPFWVESKDGCSSLQIVESAQVDMENAGQREIWKNSTHFNPVNMVCGLLDFQGKPFDLLRFVDPEAGIITKKTKDGKQLQALEHPGLWNGAMADWNTVFVEIPVETFQPVKTVLDLLRPAHQPAGQRET